MLIGKRVVDFLIVLIDINCTFSLSVTAQPGARSEYRFKIGDFAPTGAG